MPLGMDVGLSLGDFVLDGDPVFPPNNGRIRLPIFGPFLLCPNGWKHQDGSTLYWYSYTASGILHYCGHQTAGWMKTPLGTEV